MEQGIRFTKTLNFKEKKKLANEIQHENSSTSFLAKLPKISTPSIILVPSPSIETVSANLSTSNLTIKAIHKPVYKKTQFIVNKYSCYLQNSSQKSYDILEGHAVITVEEEDWKKVWYFSIEIDRVEALEPKIL